MTLRVFSRLVTIVPTIFLLLSTPVSASVVMLNTRVIYPADAQSQTLQFTNNDKIPYVMQLWSDVNNPSSTPDTADAPFVTVPAMFRIEPNTGQSIRLAYTGKDLPQDRESIFYLNSVQIPPKNAVGAENQMMVILRNRVKIFYRPKNIEGRADQISQKIHFSLKEVNGRWALNVNNDSGYYASIISASVVVGKKEVPFKANMIAPKSAAQWFTETKGNSLSGAQKVKFTLVNDYGGQTKAENELGK